MVVILLLGFCCIKYCKSRNKNRESSQSTRMTDFEPNKDIESEPTITDSADTSKVKTAKIHNDFATAGIQQTDSQPLNQKSIPLEQVAAMSEFNPVVFERGVTPSQTELVNKIL